MYPGDLTDEAAVLAWMIKETEPEAYSLKIPAQDPKPEKKAEKPVKAEPKKAEKEEPAGDGSPDADDDDDDQV